MSVAGAPPRPRGLFRCPHHLCPLSRPGRHSFISLDVYGFVYIRGCETRTNDAVVFLLRLVGRIDLMVCGCECREGHGAYRLCPRRLHHLRVGSLSPSPGVVFVISLSPTSQVCVCAASPVSLCARRSSYAEGTDLLTC